jgi:hypothetical protein
MDFVAKQIYSFDYNSVLLYSVPGFYPIIVNLQDATLYDPKYYIQLLFKRRFGRNLRMFDRLCIQFWNAL